MRRVYMGMVKDILVYRNAGMTQRETAAACGCSVGKVNAVLSKIEAGGVRDPLSLTERELAAILYPPMERREKRPEPDLEYIHRQMQRKGMTLLLLWEEYRDANPQGLMLAQFCERYHQFRKQNDVYMRKAYKAGEWMMEDWAGMTLEWREGVKGEKRKAYFFVAVLPASALIYAEPFRDMGQEAWSEGHCGAFEYYGGAPSLLGPDNCRTAVKKAGRYESELNKSFEDLARYYGAAVVPARVRSPQDKAPVEKAVQIVERRILARLRDREFFSFDGLREEVARLLEEVNNAPFQKLSGSRRSVFEEAERQALKPLPPARYEYKQFKIAKVNFDYHVQYDGFYYSVPWQYRGKEAEIRAGSRVIEVFIEHERVAFHQRNYDRARRYTTLYEHMPDNHKAMAEWTPERFRGWAAKSGKETEAYIVSLMEMRDHPQQAFKTCAAILRLAERAGKERMERAARRAMEFRVYSVKSFEKLLANMEAETPAAVAHENIRGPEYYQGLFASDDKEARHG